MDTFILVAIIAFAVLVPATIITLIMLRSKGKIAAGWKLDSYSKNVKVDFNPEDGSILSFDFPTGYPGVHSLTKYVSELKVGDTVSITYELRGNDPVFIADGLTPELRLYLGHGRYYTLGPRNAKALGLGRFTLMVPLTPENWKTVDGVPFNYDQGHINQFSEGVPKSNVIGFIFGDEHGNAHGAYLEGGSAKFRLLSFSP